MPGFEGGRTFSTMSEHLPGSSTFRRLALYHALVALIAACVFVGSLVTLRYGGDVTGLFNIGSEFPHSPYLPEDGFHTVENEVGHDGQQFLTIAMDPLLQHEGSVRALDVPSYRYGRILYPLLGFGLGLGQPHLIPWAMVSINVLSLGALGYITSRYLFEAFAEAPAHALAETWAGHGAFLRWAPLLVLALPGVWITLFLSTSELLGLALLAATLWAMSRQWIVAATVALAAVCLTRETYLAVWFVLLLWTGGVHRRWREAWTLSFAALPAVAWHGYVLATLGRPDGVMAQSFGVPLAGLVVKTQVWLAGELTGRSLYEAMNTLVIFAAAAVVLGELVRGWRKATLRTQSARRQMLPLVAALPLVAILASLRVQILGYYADYMRVFSDMMLVVLLALAVPGLRWLKLGVLGAGGVLGVAFIAYVAGGG